MRLIYAKKNRERAVISRPERSGRRNGWHCSAVRELGEKELFDTANKIVLRKMAKKTREFAQQVWREARRIGRGNTTSPWREFDFYAQCLHEPEAAGEHVALLGPGQFKLKKSCD